MRLFFYPRQLCLCAIAILVCAGYISHAQVRAKNRSYDGSNNNLQYPKWGAANIPLYRELPAEYGDGLNALGGTNRPSTRKVSNVLSSEPQDIHNKRDMAGLFYIWGQFIDHDITSTPTGTEKAPIPLPSDESKFTSPISFTRSLPFPGTGINSPRDQKNESNAWIDGSMIYGNDEATAKWLRTFKYGKLWVSKGNLLPFNTDTREESGTLDPTAPKMDDDNGRTKKTFAAGDHRAAEHPGLTSLHTLFVREHNRICDRLVSQGMTNDEEIYQKARKEIGALIQNITYGQWLTAMGIQLKSYAGYNSSVRPDIMNTFATAAYRWHTMVENDIIFRDNECHGVGPSELPLKEVFFNISIVQKYGISTILKGLSVHRQYETDLKVNNGLRNFLLGNFGTDLVAINLQRGRDHGLPNYNAVRKLYTGTKAYTFYDINPDYSIASKLQSLYGSVDNVDLWAGLFAEPLMYGKSVGKTVDALIRSQFEKLRDGDYYFYLNDPELSADLARIKSTKLSDIISRNTSASNFQDNIFFRKHCDSKGDDIAHYPCNVTPQFDGWTYIGSGNSKKYYKWNGSAVTHKEAEEIASRIGGHLPQIKNAAENNNLKNYLGGGTCWLDLNRNGLLWQYGIVFDVNDNPLPTVFSTYFNWRLGEPNNVGGTENSVQMTSTGQWNDISENSLQNVVAEVECQEDCVNDLTAPEFTYCPQNISVGAGLLTLCKPVVWTAPTATDNCGTAYVTQTSGLWNGSCFFTGTYPIVYTAKDAKGNKSTCSFTVTVYKTNTLFLQGQENITMEAHAEPNRVNIQWVSNLSLNQTDYFEVKKLNNTSQEFESIAIVNNTNVGNDLANFVHFDEKPTEGDNFYKVTAVLNDGSIKESSIQKVNFGKAAFANVYPNPTETEFNIDLSNYKNNPVSIYLYNKMGQIIAVKHIESASGTAQMDVSNANMGQYLLRIVSKGKKDFTKQVTIAH